MDNLRLGSRLKALRESAGLSVKDAAKKLEFQSYQTLSSIEAGSREVKASELSLFSKAYFCSISDILDDKEFSHPCLMWRNAPQEKNRIEQQILHFCEQYKVLEELLNIKPGRELGWEVRDKEGTRTNADVDALADDTRNILGLGKRPAFSLESILEQDYGIKIIYRRLSYAGSAASMVDDELGAVMVINADEAPWRRNYDIGHELFHILTSRVVTAGDIEDKSFFVALEKRADRFSSALLLPETEVRREIRGRLNAKSQLSFSDLVDVAREFGVSSIALLDRLASLGLMTSRKVDELKTDDTLKQEDLQTRGDEWSPPPSTRFRSLAVRCLRKGLISRGKFAEMMEIDRSRVDDFIGSYGMMQTEGVPIAIMASGRRGMKRITRLGEAMLETARDMWDAGVIDEKDYYRVLTGFAHLKRR